MRNKLRQKDNNLKSDKRVQISTRIKLITLNKHFKILTGQTGQKCQCAALCGAHRGSTGYKVIVDLKTLLGGLLKVPKIRQ